MNNGKIKSYITKLINNIYNFMPFKAVMLRFEGNGASDPTIEVQYNVTSLVRTGIGAYRITITKPTFLGVSVSNFTVSSITHSVAPSVNSDFFTSEAISVSSTIFDVQVSEVSQGAGNRLDILPYDIIAGDRVHVMLLMSLGNRLPGE
jgi:hypothetical protein